MIQQTGVAKITHRKDMRALASPEGRERQPLVSAETQPVSLMSFVKHRWHDWNVLHARQRAVGLGADRAEERAGPEGVRFMNQEAV